MIAAVRSGADAVYIGAKQFSARAGAHNFDDSEMRECVRYCHQRDVKVYLALNTLVFDDEMDNALEVAKSAARADVDALIVQDIGLISLIRKAIPEMPLHASTQMSVHTPFGAKALYEMGFKRVVLSRELSLDEIRKVREFCPEVELEIFVHGALCMCVSGQCYFSAMLGGRSANRGMCAQPCRLPMQFGENDHALSLKDNGSLNYLKELEEIGVASAKIEGRMKRPEYVAAATAAAVEARKNGAVSDVRRERLKAVFSRTGFTDGYLRGEIGAEMFGYRRRDDVITADGRLLREIRTEYKDEFRRVPIKMTLTVSDGEKPKLEVSDGEISVAVEGKSVAEKAINLPLNRENAAKNLTKTGGTPYFVSELNTSIGESVAMPASALNALRREALEKLTELRGAVQHHYAVNDFETKNSLEHEKSPGCPDWVCSPDTELPAELKDRWVFVALDGLTDDQRIKQLLDDGWQLGVEAPRVCFFDEEALYEQMSRLYRLGVTRLLAHNIAAAYIGKQIGFSVVAGFGMNLCNSWSLSWAKRFGIIAAEISVETDQKRIGLLKKAIPVGVIRYGYFPLMICRNAPAGMNESCKTEQFLQDRKSERFRVINRGSYTEIYNCVPIVMPLENNNSGGRIFNIIRFSVENSVDNKEKILEKIRGNHGFERFTHGLYTRGVK